MFTENLTHVTSNHSLLLAPFQSFFFARVNIDAFSDSGPCSNCQRRSEGAFIMSQGARGAQGLEPAEDAVSLSALSEDDLTHIANIPQYRAMLHDLLSPYMGESSVSTEPAR